MFFRRFLNSVIITSSVLGLAGCGEYLNGKKATPEIIELSDDRFSCLKDLPEHLKGFSVGEAEPKEIESSVVCMQTALSYFQKKTKGSSLEAYTIEDMRKFFGKYFLKKNNVTPEFALELMKIKKALLGGSDRYITKEEILRLVDLLTVIKEEAIKLTPHVKILLSQEDKTSFDKVSNATEVLRDALQRILSNSQVAKSDYGFEDAKRVLSGFAEFIKGQETFAPYERYKSWVPLVESVKNVLMGERAHFSTVNDWSAALDNLIDLYELVLKYHYVIQDFKVGNRTELRQLSQFIGQGLALLESSHQMKAHERIPFKDIDRLLDEAFKTVAESGVKIPVRVESVKEVYQLAILRALEPARQGDSRGLDSLKRSHLSALRREFNVWRLTQSFFDHLPFSEEKEPISQKVLLEQYNKFDVKYVVGSAFNASMVEQTALRDSWKDLGHLLQTTRVVNFNEEGRLIIAYEPALYAYSWSSLTKFNLMKTLARFLMIGYGSDIKGELSQGGIPQKGLSQWYDDFKNLGLDLKAFDPRGANAGNRSFLEANFFTYSGNGDDKMDYRETFEFVSVLVSAGLGSSNFIQKSMAQCEVDQVDVFGFKMFEENCFRLYMRRDFAKFFNNMPWMVEYVRTMSHEQWTTFYSAWLAASRVATPVQGRVEMAEVRTMVTLLHYVENIMTIYDVDQSGGLSLDEVEASAPRFMSFLKVAAPIQWETAIKEGFASMVFNGEIPGFWGLTGFQFSKHFKDDAPRANLLRILQVLKDELNKPKK